MRKEWILTEEEKVNKKRRIEENRRLRLVNTLDTIEEPKDIMDFTEKKDIDLKTAVLEKNLPHPSKSTQFVRNSDFIDNVANALHDGFKLNPAHSYAWSYPLAKKITALYQILQTKNTTALRLISFFKRLTDFDALNEADKVNLVKSNLPAIFFFHASLG